MEIFVLLISSLMFFGLGYSKYLSYKKKPVWTATALFVPACLLAYSINSLSIIVFQVLLISSAILHVNSLKFESNFSIKISAHIEKIIILGVIVSILLLPLPYKSLLLLALVAFRILNHLKGYFPESIFLKKEYTLYTMFAIWIAAFYTKNVL